MALVLQKNAFMLGFYKSTTAPSAGDLNSLRYITTWLDSDYSHWLKTNIKIMNHNTKN